MKTKVRKWLAAILILIALCSIFPLPVPINKALTGIEISIGNHEVTEDNVIIKGIYYRYLFRDNVFKGKLQIESRDSLGKRKLLELKLSKEPYLKGKTGPLSYYDGEKNKILYSGSISVKKNFEDILIWYPSRGEEERFFLSSRLDYPEAIERINDWTNGMFGFH